MTEVSLNFREQAYAQETGAVNIGLLTIDHESLTEPIRISTDPTQRVLETGTQVIYGTISRGNTFYFFPVSLKLPDDTDDGPGLMSLELDNVTRDYIEVIRSIVGRPRVMAEWVLDSTPDVVENSWPEFLLINIKYDAMTISAQMHMEMLHDEPYPAMTFTPGRAPGLH